MSLRSSSSRSTIDLCWKMMLLMVLAGELACDMNESRSVLALDDADGDRRNEVRMLWAEKRAAMAWKRVVCILVLKGGLDLALFGDSNESSRCVLDEQNE